MQMDMQESSDVCCCSSNLIPLLGKWNRKGNTDVRRV